jgi:hypothetical protein
MQGLLKSKLKTRIDENVSGRSHSFKNVKLKDGQKLRRPKFNNRKMVDKIRWTEWDS